MSQENVEVVRRWLAAWTAGDAETMAALCHDDVEFVALMAEAFGEEAYRGKDVWQSYFNRLRETWEEWRIEDLEILEGKNERLVAVLRLVARGKGSGALVHHRVGMTVRLRDGTLWRMRTYPDPRDALEAVGLSEHDAHADS
jgi:ketosteroid isomerase-like protein